MAGYAPVTLIGNHLGERHRHFNSLVCGALARGVTLQEAEHLPEIGPLDRLIKIELASKLRNVDYIIQNLKDDDMLYVSKSLTATWLLEPEYRSIIKPKHLEDVLFPQMITPAISKMKHWLYINLRDPHRCAEFYEHYKQNSFHYAIKFLCNCAVDYISHEFPKILTKITPHYLKIFSERSPKFAKIYFDALATNNQLVIQYLKEQNQYCTAIKCVLKSAPEVFLDIAEATYDFGSLSVGATKFIAKHCKARFMEKAELYAKNLHIPTLAKYLNVEECEELVLKLARAKYLGAWFSYHNVEPLVKRLSPDQRAAFKRRVFVDKDIGDCVEEWPYPTSKPLVLEGSSPHVFDDAEIDVVDNELCLKFCSARMSGYGLRCECLIKREKIKTELDRLYDEYRFIGFSRSLHELRQRLSAAGSLETRRNILLVLVSKTGGREECVAQLLDLLARHYNEPANLRAAIIRSLVKRARMWRLPAEQWAALLEFGHGLGLDGAPAEVECEEGLHVVIIRQLLSANECESALRNAFLKKISTLSEYSLKADERSRIVDGLARLLLSAAVESDASTAEQRLSQLLDVYKTYKIRIDTTSGIVAAVKVLADRDPASVRQILHQLYEARVARRDLFIANLELRRDAASFVNILRHDPNLFAPEHVIERLLASRRNSEKRRFDQFTRKLSLYFNDGLASDFLAVLKKKIVEKPDVRLARSIALVIEQGMTSYLQMFDAAKNDVNAKRMAAALRASAHLCRPKLDIDAFEMKYLGVKAIATRALICRTVAIEKYLDKLLSWKRTMRLAIVLSQRNGSEAIAFTTAARVHPLVAIKSALQYLRRRGDSADYTVWEAVKPLILNTKVSKRLQGSLIKAESIPSTIKADYCATVFTVLIKIPGHQFVCWELYRNMDKILPSVNNQSMDNIVSTLLLTDLETMTRYSGIFVKYLLLCESEHEQIDRYEKIGVPFFEFIAKLPIKKETVRFGQQLVNKQLTSILKSLKYNKVFFDTKYVSCLPVLERIVVWMKKILPVEEYFNKYAQLHLTMTYFRAVRQSIKNMPEVFNNTDRQMDEGVGIVGATFGKYIARELRDLISRYFDSIVELYSEALIYYIDVYFLHGPSKNILIGAVMRGILECSEGSECRLAVNIFKNRRSDLGQVMGDEIKGIINGKNVETRFFLNAELCGEPCIRTP